jgi:DNA-binding GntR family transcriptional regulator
MTSKSQIEGKLPLFRSAAETIRYNIQKGRLRPDIVLLEGPIADLLNISRAPVKRALALLEEEGIIRRFDGRGYLVGPPNGAVEPIRTSLRSLDLVILNSHPEPDSRSNWQRIYRTIEDDVSACLVFGQYRLVENALALHFAVSRTVVRDVLQRLQERGLVTKTATSRWLVAPLTAQTIKDKFELATILEVAALRSANELTSMADLQKLGNEFDAAACAEEIDPRQWFDLVNAFIDIAILSTPNNDLRLIISNNRKMLQASQNALFRLGLSGDVWTIRELRMICDLLVVGATEGAAKMLENHLLKSRERTIAQLKIVAVLPHPPHIAPYLLAS